MAADRVRQLGGAPGDRPPGDEEHSRTGASVVVATVGRPHRLARLVDAVLTDPAAAELVVVVDGPDQRSVTVLESLAVTRPRLHPVTVPHQGQLGALATGVRIAAYDLIVLLDDDVLPAPGTIAGHVAAHRDRPGSVVVGPMPVALDPLDGDRGRSRDGRRPGVATRLYAAEYDAHLDALGRRDVDVLDVLWTGNLSIGRDDCLRVGLPSPAFTAHYHADQDLGLRLRAAGLVGRLDPSLVARHFHDRTDADFLRDAR
ncbi:MAG TPA: glycosyltransferase, partial [Acidimicrobiales bacterium]